MINLRFPSTTIWALPLGMFLGASASGLGYGLYVLAIWLIILMYLWLGQKLGLVEYKRD